MRVTSLIRPAVFAAVVTAVGALGTTLPQASASPVRATHGRPKPDVAPAVQPFAALRRPALPAGEHYVCPAPTRPGQMTCMSIIAGKPHHGSGWAVPASASDNYGPSQLRNAYKIAVQAAKNGGGRLVAIVDAFKDPNAASDLAAYRQHFNLGACTTSSGCLKIVNQSGHTSPLPNADPGWAQEESLDLDMVSAICPKCHILLVEANSPSAGDLGTAEKTAVAKGARYVSNSWSGGEFVGQDAFNSDFNHPGDVIAFAADDSGYGPQYPTDLQYVTAVGGTSLRHASNKRGWSETAWGPPDTLTGTGGTGGGCSGLEPKPSWQRADATAPDGCLLRTENDVSAVADPSTGVLIYDSYQQAPPFLMEIGGTSAATPIVTAIYALAGVPTHGSYPAEYPYLHSGHLFDITSGTNGGCEKVRQYLCHGEPGYDGPTGLGTPNGTGAFTDNSAHRVALVDPGTQDAAVGASFSLTVTGVDTQQVSSLQWSATGLPAGLSIHAITNSTKARISGTLPGAAHTYHVTVTANDGSAAETAHFNIVVAPDMAGPNPPPGPITLSADGLCLDDGTGAVSQPVKVQHCGHPARQHWAYVADGAPDDNGTVRIAGKCLSIGSGTRVVLGNCNGALNELWGYLGGSIFNLSTGGCLAVPHQSAGTQADTANCNFGRSQTWNLPRGPLIEGAGALCLNNPGGGTRVDVSTCAYKSVHTQLWSLKGDLTIRDSSGRCLAANGMLSATAVTAKSCDNSNPSQLWVPGPGSQLINLQSGKCLADQGNGGPGAGVVQNDCYGDAGELWGLN